MAKGNIDPRLREKEMLTKIRDLLLSYLMQEFPFRKHASYWMPSEVKMYRQHLVF